jgi:L-iditol 2-dehydrogenase
VAVHAAIERTQVHSGDVVLVSGPGCVGLLTAQVAKLEGARVVLAGTAKDERRLECGRKLGVDVTIDVSQQDLVDVVRGLTGGRGADTVYECSGTASSLAACWEAVKKEGTLVPLGIYPGPIETDFNKVTMKELRVIGSYGYVWTSWQRSVRLLSERKVNTDALISHVYPLEEFREAFRVTQDGTAVKVVLTPETA